MSGAARRQLDRSLAGAVAWNASGKWVSQIAGWAATLVVARLLTPFDYGIMAMAGLYLTLATLVSQVGIGEAIVALRDVSSDRVAQLNTVALLIGAGLVAVTAAMAAPLARYFGEPPLRAVVLAVSSAYLITSLQVVPRALLQRELRFRAVATVDTARNLAQAGLTVVLALEGFGYWSLALGYIAGAVVATLMLWRWRAHAFAWPSWRGLRRELRFGGSVLATGVAWYSYDNSDFLVAGKVLGGPALGNYNLAWTIACAPVEKITNLITGVTPAYFSAVQHDQAELRRYILRLSEIISYATVPASLGLALAAGPLVRVFLGPKWAGAILPLQFLGAFVAVRSLATVLPNFLIAVGEAGFVMRATVVAAIVMPVAFYLGSHWGTAGIAAAWLVGYPLVMAPVFARARARAGITLGQYASSIGAALTSSAAMAGAVLAAKLLLPAAAAPAARLAVIVAVGAATYLLVLLSLRGSRILTLVRELRATRAGESDACSAATP